MSRDFVGALLQLNAEKQVPREQLVRTVEEAIQAAYRRVSGGEDIHVRIDAETGRQRVFRARQVVGEVEDPLTEFTVDEARRFKPDAGIGDLIETEELDPEAFGRIHAQTAKQVVLQRLREAERDVVFDQFASREGEMITGSVNRVEPRAIILDVGKNVEAILATTEQSPAEHYRIGQNVKAYVLEVRRTTRGPQIYVSRTHKGFLRRLFELEVPEIHAGTVEIKAIAREAGSRSKVAVASRQEGLDPVGATVGQRGARVQAVVAELGGEKVDVIPWNEAPAEATAERAANATKARAVGGKKAVDWNGATPADAPADTIPADGAVPKASTRTKAKAEEAVTEAATTKSKTRAKAGAGSVADGEKPKAKKGIAKSATAKAGSATSTSAKSATAKTGSATSTSAKTGSTKTG